MSEATAADRIAVGRRRQVVIVGGGLAGLAAAEALCSAGGQSWQITVLEAKRICGGRAGSFEDAASHSNVDYCQHVAMGCCTNLLGLLERCQLADRLQRIRQLWFHHPDHPPSRFAANGWLPPPLHLTGSIAALRYLSRRQQRQVMRGMWRLMRTPAPALADVTAAEWLLRIGQDPETVQLFWDVILVSALGEQSTRVAMSAARKVFIDGFAAARGASDVLVPNRPLAELFGDQLPRAIGDRGVTIRTAAAVGRVRTGQVELVDGQTFAADDVIVAVPWHRLESLFDPPLVAQSLPRLAQYRRFPSSPITGLHLWFDRPITPLNQAVMVGTVSQWLFHPPFETDDGSGESYYQVVVSGSRQIRKTPRPQLIETVCQELQHAFPAVRQARLIRSRVVTDPQAVFSVDCEVEAIRPSPCTALPWLHLAGDWIDTGWPATMEGAVISGRMAAANVCRRHGQPVVPVDPGLPRGWLARMLIR